ncbi:hypothetical protein [Pedobacter sp.]|jgi:hypothetical protein|uniref:hypothetical protein n=1 Tax=Pedobacter sp. TaxID=1411316 RepID=UPI002B6A0738|nr:hypothetical protein [Pedobacter sp.]HWW39668.1 hypothetical protein [Pedobacter sp.]
MQISNLDDLLATGKITPTEIAEKLEGEEDGSRDDYENNSDIPEQQPRSNDEDVGDKDTTTNEQIEDATPEVETDDYGNKKTTDNEVIRERLKKQAESMTRKHEAEIEALRAQLAETGASREVQKAAKDFEYDPNDSSDWQQQLASFVKQTVNNMSRETEEREMRVREQTAQREFETKFLDGMNNFDDFVQVVKQQPITDAMTVATRAMKDPAAFIYAASKRHPEELKRISSIPDQYVQMVEMGRLEERMRKSKSTTSAPRPLGRATEDATIEHKRTPKEPTIEQQIAQFEARKMAKIKAKRG